MGDMAPNAWSLWPLRSLVIDGFCHPLSLPMLIHGINKVMPQLSQVPERSSGCPACVSCFCGKVQCWESSEEGGPHDEVVCPLGTTEGMGKPPYLMQAQPCEWWVTYVLICWWYLSGLMVVTCLLTDTESSARVKRLRWSCNTLTG